LRFASGIIKAAILRGFHPIRLGIYK
jgi:hypothetical protein